jgi:hypothetical protein
VPAYTTVSPEVLVHVPPVNEPEAGPTGNLCAVIAIPVIFERILLTVKMRDVPPEGPVNDGVPPPPVLTILISELLINDMLDCNDMLYVALPAQGTFPPLRDQLPPLKEPLDGTE